MNELLKDNSWKALLNNEFNKPYFLKLTDFLNSQLALNEVIFPPKEQIFEAFNSTPFNKVKVVILGQDPYHQPNQAHGLCFSVNHQVNIPPSLKNIYKELANDIPTFQIPPHGNLTQWANQGVFLLNATLTVGSNKAGSHQKKGWEFFTDEVIKLISTSKKNVVFMLWGNYAQQKENLINANNHLILKSAHPSPLSAYAGFFGNKHFSTCNQYLKTHLLEPINWQIT